MLENSMTIDNKIPTSSNIFQHIPKKGWHLTCQHLALRTISVLTPDLPLVQV
jgi:hypothetical protein